MQTKVIVAAIGLAAVALPLAVLASQPPVQLSELQRAPSLSTAQVLSMLLLDPRETTEFSVKLPEGFATLDVDADPFGD